MKIKIVNPNTTLEMTETIGKAARKVARAETEIIAVSPAFGPASIESHYDEFLCAPGLIDEQVSHVQIAVAPHGRSLPCLRATEFDDRLRERCRVLRNHVRRQPL